MTFVSDMTLALKKMREKIPVTSSLRKGRSKTIKNFKWKAFTEMVTNKSKYDTNAREALLATGIKESGK